MRMCVMGTELRLFCVLGSSVPHSRRVYCNVDTITRSDSPQRRRQLILTLHLFVREQAVALPLPEELAMQCSERQGVVVAAARSRKH